MKRVANKQTTWNLVNIKARHEQTTSHYVEAFHKLYQEDPLIKFPRGGKSGSLKSIQSSEHLEKMAVHVGYILGYFHIRLLILKLFTTDGVKKM